MENTDRKIFVVAWDTPFGKLAGHGVIKAEDYEKAKEMAINRLVHEQFGTGSLGKHINPKEWKEYCEKVLLLENKNWALMPIEVFAVMWA